MQNLIKTFQRNGEELATANTLITASFKDEFWYLSLADSEKTAKSDMYKQILYQNTGESQSQNETKIKSFVSFAELRKV